MFTSPHRQEDRSQQQDNRVDQSFVVNENLYGEKKYSPSHNPATRPRTVGRRLTEDPWSTRRVRKAQGNPRPSRMSKILLPMELDTAMSPMPGEERDKQTQRSQSEHRCDEQTVGGGYLAELQSDWPCSLEHWFPLPGR